MVQGADTYAYTVDSADQLITTKKNAATFESFVNDNDGNTVARTAASTGTVIGMMWSDFNNLVGFTSNGVSQESDFYDSDGIRRIRGDGTKYYQTGGANVADSRPTGQVSFFFGHQLLGLQQGGSIYFVLTDGLGSVRQVVTSTGASSATFATDEYGVPTASSGSAELLANTYVGALGVRNETGTPSGVANRGLYYMQQRWYDPSIGRFLSQDPIGFAGGLNVYGYVGVNPVNWVDPRGLETVSPNWQGGAPSYYAPDPTPFGIHESRYYRQQISAAARRTGIPAEVIMATLSAELAGGCFQDLKYEFAKRLKNPNDVSTGIAQFKPFRAADTDQALGHPVLSTAEYARRLLDPSVSIDYLANTLSVSVRRYAGSFPKGSEEYWALIASAHNDPRYLGRGATLDAYAQKLKRRIQLCRQ